MSSPDRVLDIPALGYGAANVGNLFRALSDDDAWAVLDAAWESGIRYYDTAPHYGLGLSERRLGAFLQTKPRDEFVLSTKAGRLLRPNPEHTGGLDTANDFHVPDDLQRELDARHGAAAFFAGLDSRNRYAILYRLQEAKKPETRARRLEKFVAMLEAGETIYPPVKKRG